MTAKLRVPAGSPDQLSWGDLSSPVQPEPFCKNGAAISLPVLMSLLVTVNGFAAWASEETDSNTNKTLRFIIPFTPVSLLICVINGLSGGSTATLFADRIAYNHAE